MPKKPPKRQPGPEAERLKLDGPDWKANVQKALRKPSPPEGWPKPEPKASKANKRPRRKDES